MRIAQISPVFDEVSVDSRVEESRHVAVLAKGLVNLGHDVTVFASGDSTTSGTLVPLCHRALRHHPAPKRNLSEGLMYLALEKTFAASPRFDLIHVHAGFAAFPLMRRSPVPILATVYGPLDGPEVRRVYQEFRELALVATSFEQIRRCPDLNWHALVPQHVAGAGEWSRWVLQAGVPEELASAYDAVYERLAAIPVDRLDSLPSARTPDDVGTPV